MPTTVTSGSNYAGKAAGAIIGASFKEADTIAKGAINVLQGINYKENLRRIRYTDGTTAYACGFTPAGAIVLSEKVIEPIKLKNDLKVCKETFRNQWGEDVMGLSAGNPQMHGPIEEAILAEVLKSTAERTDSVIWTGDNSANDDEWDGFITLWAADSAVIKATANAKVGAAVTKANVLSAFEVASGLVPIALRRKDLVFAISPDVELAYTQYLVANGLSNGLGGNANTGLNYGRYALTTLNGLPSNTIAIYERTNLVFATGLTGDHNSIAAMDEDAIGLMTGEVRVKMVYNGGCGYYNSEDIVYFDIAANPS
jgi:hypothetical protein